MIQCMKYSVFSNHVIIFEIRIIKSSFTRSEICSFRHLESALSPAVELPTEFRVTSSQGKKATSIERVTGTIAATSVKSWLLRIGNAPPRY